METKAHSSASNQLFYSSRINTSTLRPGKGISVVPNAYLGISSIKRALLRQKASSLLVERTLIQQIFFCTGGPRAVQRAITPTVYELVEYLRVVAPETPGIFRREGKVATTVQIVGEIIEHDRTHTNMPFDFARYTPLELGSALKYYIREVMNGLFDIIHLGRIFDSIQQGEEQHTELLCKYLVFAMTDDERRLFIELKKLFSLVAANKVVNGIGYESIGNIFCLTLTPQEAFNSLDVIPRAVQFFKTVIAVDMNDVNLAVDILQNH
ncbi:hypothetical protein PAPHI01_0558 [Pancytospora philotis]|nr:hypothetical protein PAPHI01_0558 [Pancytospora philotis]